MSVLSEIRPQNVFSFFETISSIPRGSGHTERISQYCDCFASDRGLKHFCDEIGNVVIFKDGSKGRENEEPLILQGHLDMVWEKDPDIEFDFMNSGLNLCTDGEYIFAKGTTLGGDDGIAVAICLAVLDDNSLSHPPLEVIFTVDEETGMEGARGIDVSSLKGKRMINLDSEAEDVLWVSCAGGARADISLEVKNEPNTLKAYRLLITGLHGGHSGAEIHKNYANANVLLGRTLKEISEKTDIYISSLWGGKAGNAITPLAECVICTSDDISGIVSDCEKRAGEEFAQSDPNIEFILTQCTAEKHFSKETGDRVISLLSLLPYGVIKMSGDIQGLVQTSLNPGILSSTENAVNVGWSVRSSVNSEKEELINQLRILAEKHGASFDTYGGYPAWEYRADSPLRDRIAECYTALTGKKPEITAIHAGLECGLFSDKIKGLDSVSIGPDMQDIHTPREKLSIPSVKWIYELLLKVMEVI